jgi:hypothetical protein
MVRTLSLTAVTRIRAFVMLFARFTLIEPNRMMQWGGVVWMRLVLKHTVVLSIPHSQHTTLHIIFTMSRRSVSHHSASGRSSHPREQTTKTRTACHTDRIAASHSGSRAGSQAGSRAGPPAGSVAGSRAGSKAGSVAGSVAGSKAASRAGSQVGSKAGSQYSHARSSTAVSEADYGYAASGSLYRPPYTTIGKWAANSYPPRPSVASSASSHYTNASMQRSDTSSSQHRAWNTWGRKYCYENGRQVSEFPQSSSGRSRHDPSRYAVVYEEQEEVVCGPGWNFAPVSRAATGQ